MDKFQYLSKLPNPIIFDKLGTFAYIPINKAAQTSVTRNILRDRAIVKKDDKDLWLSYSEQYLNEKEWQRLNTFAICRHPLDKFISAYFYLAKKNRIDPCSDINDFVAKNLTKKSNPNKIDLHFQLQWNAFYFKNNLLVDHLIRLENISYELPKILSTLGFNTDIPHKNQGTNKDKNQILNKQSLDILESVYSNDLKFLNYKKWSK